MKQYIYLAALVFSTTAEAGNFATCILDRMPGTQNDAVMRAVFQICSQKYPGRFEFIPQGQGRGWFGYDSGVECAAKEAAKTPNNRAANLISIACRRLYDAP